MKPHLRLAQARARVIRTLAGRAAPAARERALVDALRAVEGVRDVELWNAERARDLPLPSPFGGAGGKHDDGVHGWALAIEATTLDLTDTEDRGSRLLVVPLWGDEGCGGALAVRTDGRPDQDTLDQIRALAFCARELLDEVRDPTNDIAPRSQLSAVFAPIIELEPRTLWVVDMSAGAHALFGPNSAIAQGTNTFVASIATVEDRERLERTLLKSRPNDPQQELVVRTNAPFPWSRVGIQIVALADRLQCILQDKSRRKFAGDPLSSSELIGHLPSYAGQGGRGNAAACAVSLNTEVERVTGIWRAGPGREHELELALNARQDLVKAPAGALDGLLWTLLMLAETAEAGSKPPRFETQDRPGGVSLRVSPALDDRDSSRQVGYLVSILDGTLDRTLSEAGEIRLEISLPPAQTPRPQPQDSLPAETRGS